MDPLMKAGTFDPGAVVSGKTVSSWHVTNTVPVYAGRNRYRDVKVEFTDGSYAYVTELFSK